MNICIVAPRFPFPLDKGDRLTIYHMLRYLSQRHEVSLICFLEADQDAAWVEKVEPFCQRVEIIPLRKSRAYANTLLGLPTSTPMQVHYYSDGEMKAKVREVVADLQPDILYAHTIRMGSYVVDLPAKARVMGMQISMTLNYRRLMEKASNPASKIFNWLEYQKLRRFESPFASRFDKVLLISPHDLNAIENNDQLDNVFFSPHGVDFEFFSPDTSIRKEPKSIIFTGNMNYAPNVDAALYFYNDILPLVRERVPELLFSIVGANPVPELVALQKDSQVRVTGRVPDLRDYMNSAQIAIDPLRVGAGLQNKVLEGMSMGLPMVITSVANEGIQANDEQNVLIGDTPAEFADHVAALLESEERRQSLGVAAREFIVEKWSWEKHFADFEEMLEGLAGKKKELVG